MHNFDVFNECITVQPTDRQTDTAYYRGARTHLKRGKTRKIQRPQCNVWKGKKLSWIYFHAEP